MCFCWFVITIFSLQQLVDDIAEVLHFRASRDGERHIINNIPIKVKKYIIIIIIIIIMIICVPLAASPDSTNDMYILRKTQSTHIVNIRLVVCCLLHMSNVSISRTKILVTNRSNKDRFTENIHGNRDCVQQ